MGLLNIFNKQKSIVKEYSYTTAKNFRGFHRFIITTHGNPEVEKNNAAFKDKDVIGHPLVFRDESENAITIWLDGLKIGVVYDEDEIKVIRSSKITDVFVKFEEETVIGKSHTEKRVKAQLFVKEK